MLTITRLLFRKIQTFTGKVPHSFPQDWQGRDLDKKVKNTRKCSTFPNPIRAVYLYFRSLLRRQDSISSFPQQDLALRNSIRRFSSSSAEFRRRYSSAESPTVFSRSILARSYFNALAMIFPLCHCSSL